MVGLGQDRSSAPILRRVADVLEDTEDRSLIENLAVEASTRNCYGPDANLQTICSMFGKLDLEGDATVSEEECVTQKADGWAGQRESGLVSMSNVEVGAVLLRRLDQQAR